MGQTKLRGGWAALQALFALGLGALAISTLADFWSLTTALPPALIALSVGCLIALVGHWRRWAGWALADGLLLILLYLIWAKRPVKIYFEELLRLWQAWVIQLQTTPDWTFDARLGALLLIVIASAVGWLLARDLFRRQSPLFSLTGGTLFYAGLWALFYDQALNYYLLFLVGTFAAWAIGQAGRRQGSWRSEGRRATSDVRLWPALLALLPLTLATAWLPPALEPIDLGKANLWLQEAIPVLSQLRGGSGGSGNFFTGFSSDVSRLGGAATLSEQVILTVDLLEAPDAPALYLRGAAADYYNGQGWQRSVAPAVVNGTRSSQIRNSYADAVHFKTARVRVLPTAYGGRELFHPLEPRFANLSGDNDGWVYDPYLGNLTANRSPNEPYTIQASIPLWNDDQLRELTEGQPLKEPDTQGVTPYVQLLTDELVGQFDNPFTKARLIEAWLRATFPYTLEMEPTPPGVDFVEYFLTEQQQGYCVYYASAMAVMLRSQGIESRWVNGFVVPLDKGPTRYEVKGSQAHAWVEANLPGYGWVTFDPTPRADFPIPNRTQELPQQTNETPNLPTDITPEQPEIDPIDELPEATGATPTEIAGSTGGQSNGLTMALAAVAIIAPASWLLVRRWQRWEPASPGRQGTIEAFLRTSRLLGLFGLARRPDQTSQEYARAAVSNWPELPMQELANHFDQARYGPADQHQTAKGQETWTQAKAAVKGRHGWRYYLKRLFRSP